MKRAVLSLLVLGLSLAFAQPGAWATDPLNLSAEPAAACPNADLERIQADLHARRRELHAYLTRLAGGMEGLARQASGNGDLGRGLTAFKGSLVALSVVASFPVSAGGAAAGGAVTAGTVSWLVNVRQAINGLIGAISTSIVTQGGALSLPPEPNEALILSRRLTQNSLLHGWYRQGFENFEDTLAEFRAVSVQVAAQGQARFAAERAEQRDRRDVFRCRYAVPTEGCPAEVVWNLFRLNPWKDREHLALLRLDEYRQQLLNAHDELGYLAETQADLLTECQQARQLLAQGGRGDRRASVRAEPGSGSSAAGMAAPGRRDGRAGGAP